jgi:putative Mg2+ transporter-C (MgtC) family protein
LLALDAAGASAAEPHPKERLQAMSTLDIVLTTIQTEFSDVFDAERLTRLTVRLGMALLLGAVIGWDRERRDTDAGLRTHMLVAMGSALFVLVAIEAGLTPDGVSRVAQGIVAGIGFLGAGAVLKNPGDGHIHGLTTAASIWATAAVGFSVGLGLEGTAVVATLFALIVLAALRRFSHRIRDQARHPEAG